MPKNNLLIKIYLCVAALSVYGFYKWSQIPENQKSGIFNTKISSVESAKESEVVYLKDGDEYTLTAEYVVKEIGNRQVRMLAYNGSIPGPFFHIDQGAQITIHFTNKTDIETTIHSHGLRLNYLFDGTPDLSQKPIQPGETFSYQLKFPDAGAYWYHPHIREDYAQELGLYGNYIVTPKEYELPEVNREESLILDDLLIEDGQLVTFFKDKTNFALMGRFGNIMLVNGSSEHTLEVNQGDTLRLFITNSANARPFDISLPGARLKLVGSDGSPYEKEAFIENLIISPSERYIVDVLFDQTGEYELLHSSHDRAMGEREYILSKITVKNENTAKDFLKNFNTLHVYKKVSEEMSNLKQFIGKKPDRTLSLTLDPGKVNLGQGMQSMPCHKMPDGNWMGECDDAKKEAWLKGLSTAEEIMGGEKIHWEDHTYALNKTLTNEDIIWKLVDKNTGKFNHAIDDWQFKVGELVKIRLFNDPMSAHPMQHPFHMHGQRFAVLATNGVENENKVWKDTTLVQVGDTVDIIVEMSNPGIWMAHCHIAEHMHSGMMFSFAVGQEHWKKVTTEHQTH